MTFDEAVELLSNWGAWSRERVSRRKCGSAEGNYKPKPNDDDREAQAFAVVNVRDAVKSDIIIQKLPLKYKWLLVSVHVYGRQYVAQRDREVRIYLRKKGFAMTFDEQVNEHRRAVLMYANNYAISR